MILHGETSSALVDQGVFADQSRNGFGVKLLRP